MSSTSISIAKELRKTKRLFSDAEIPSSRLDAEVLLAHVLGVTRPYLHAHPTQLLQGGTLSQGASLQQFEELVARRVQREPIAYIVGTKEFYGREFAVTPDVLIPRPETEELIELFLETRVTSQESREAQSTEIESEEAGSRQPTVGRETQNATVASEPDTTSAIHLQPESALLRTQGRPGAKPWSESMYPESARKRKVLDVGCGSGCIGITLKLERPELDVTLCDISPKALTVAKKNANKLQADVGFVESDLLSHFLPPKIQNPKSKIYFDAIVANLPYVHKTWDTSPETAYEPSLALYAKDDGLELIKKLIEQSADVLNEHGLLLLEADPEQHSAIAEVARRYGFQLLETKGYALSFTKRNQA